jgi:hypothetical protein
MTSRSNITTIMFDGRRLLAMASGGIVPTLRGGSVLSAAVPEGLDISSPIAVGAWLKMELRSAQLGAGRVVWLVPRAEAIVRGVNLPKAQITEEEEGAMVRLAAARMVSFAIEQAGVDYWKSEAEGGALMATAAILPVERLTWIRETAAAAGVKLVRIGLSTGGLIAAAGPLSGRTAVVAVGWSGVEVALLDEGYLALSRVLDVPRATKREDMAEYLDRLESELSRAWVTHVGSGGSAPQQVMVLGRGELAEKVGETVAKVMGCSGRMQIRAAEGIGKGVSDADAGAAAALAGALVEETSGVRTLDLGGFRKPVDRHAKTRQMVLLGVLGVIVVGGGAGVLGMLRLAGIEEESARLQGTQGKLNEEYGRYLMVHARDRHVKQWMSNTPDWIGHLQAINQVFPDPATAQVDAINAVLDAKVTYIPDSRDARYPNGKWVSPVRATIALDGRVKARESAEDFRGKLVAGNVYQVESRGPDTPDRFSYQLVTGKLTPKSQVKIDPKTEEKPDSKTSPTANQPAASTRGGTVSGGGK